MIIPQTMKNLYYKLLNTFFSFFPIKKKKIFFLSYYGSQYGCNPKYLSEYIVENCKGWDVVWGFTEPDRHVVHGARKVKYMSLRYFFELYTSQVLVANYRMTELYHKRRGQLYIQTWHSSLRLKMIEGDAVETLPHNYVRMAKADSKQIDILLSGCDYSTQIFKRAFWYDGQIVPTGTPREDLLLNANSSRRNEIFKKIGIHEGTHILLYAPTFRKDNKLTCYNIDFKRLVTSIKEKYQGNWIILLRLHPHLQHFSKKLLNDASFLVDTTSYDDIQELLMIADVVISDYSSLIFDFALTGRPCFLYIPDLKEYTAHDRNLYFDINDLPFPISHNNEELSHNIQSFNIDNYQLGIKNFLQQTGSYEDGHACERTWEYIIKALE